MNQYFRFHLTKIPFYYVSGLYTGTQDWCRKELIQPGNYGIMVVLRGEVYLQIGQQDYTVRKNEYLVVPPFKSAQGFQPIPTGSQYIWLHFFPRQAVEVGSHYHKAGVREAVLPQHGQLFNAPRVVSAAVELINSEGTASPYYSDLAVAKFLVLISYDHAQLVQSRYGQAAHQNVANQVHKYLLVHFLEIDHLAELADVWGFSVPYLNRKFKAKYHVSLYEFLIEQRLQYAKNLLVFGNDPVYAVASQAHFRDSKNFYRMFKKRVGTSPLQYRKLHADYRISTPTYDSVIPVSDKIMDQLIKDGLKWPHN
ncbi:AraC family transcriptional regulator [Lactiplantibacillus plantarum]|uniref:helix-turn-helix domain-containing protein n=1 Tax=Lactiplantibacillus plantarum TaxID=1590 RepID=UPI001E549888|nr:AraC family transcriptional regulator [Lactiplantibacillus plantarum]MCC6117805.1 AraC family transcriptional regulator [Lactiplantibacillus plantarum]MCW6115352.1 AraC family transcriptional regulator [Lactiplantibacillus plantarum]